jgi:tetratricopeptide (TPR) repeat protein
MEPEKGEALLLLAELLQEQGCWSDSLQIIEQSETAGKMGRSQVLAMQARFQLYGQDAEQASAGLLTLLDIVRQNDDPSLRIAAAGTATTLAVSLRDQSLTKALLDALITVPASDLNPADRTNLSLAKARLMFQKNDCASSLNEIEGATMLLLSPEVISTAAAQLQAGLGAICCMRGHYANGRVFLQKGCEIAARLGNDTLQSGIAANLALVLGRLGMYPEQLHWAEKILGTERNASADYTELLAAYCGAFACCSLGYPSRAAEFIENSGRRITGGLPRWALQGWLLYSADVYVLLGRPDDARAEASRAVEGVNSTLHVSNFAGPFCRWTAKLASDRSGFVQAISKVESFRARLQSFDALDRAEILAAVGYLRKKLGLASDDITTQLRDQLCDLPLPVTNQFRSLGILE